jgi:hypothetical protein
MNAFSTATYFRFEEDFVEEGIRCIPMIVRFKLDRCGIKLRLAEWSRMNESERQHLAEQPCESEGDVTVYRSWLQMTVYKRTRNHATDLVVDISPPWMSDRIPSSIVEKIRELGLSLTDSQWNSLTDLQKFALVKLSRPGHENHNFPIALKEFVDHHNDLTIN